MGHSANTQLRALRRSLGELASQLENGHVNPSPRRLLVMTKCILSAWHSAWHTAEPNTKQFGVIVEKGRGDSVGRWARRRGCEYSRGPVLTRLLARDEGWGDSPGKAESPLGLG